MSTIIFPENASPIADAEAIRHACEGWGTDERKIISILGHRNASQRKRIREIYEEMYGEDLLKRLEKELSSDFEKVVYRWVLEPTDREAVLLNQAIKKKPSPNYGVIIEISCVQSPEDLLAIKRAYLLRFNHSLEEDLAHYTSGDIRQLLVGLGSVYRYHGSEVDVKLAEKEATILNNAFKDKNFNHEEVLRIITTRSKTQLLAITNCYKDKYGTSITKHVRDDQENNYLIAVRTAIRCITNHHKYYEKVLRQAINKLGTDEDALTRVIVTRAEKDLKDIKEEYLKRNSVNLEQAVSNDTSGDYKTFLLTLLGNNDLKSLGFNPPNNKVLLT